MLRIAVIDDDEAVRDGLAALLQAQGHAPTLYRNPEEYRAAGAEFDCILLDLWFEHGSHGIELLRRLVESGNPTPVIMMTQAADVESAFRAGSLGAVSFLPKPIRGLELAAALARVRSARPRPSGPNRDDIRRRLDCLTPTEWRVLECLAKDRSNKEIARALAMSVRTVECHRARIIEKLGTRSKIAMRDMLTLRPATPI